MMEPNSNILPLGTGAGRPVVTIDKFSEVELTFDL
jgi:hypothetical protein